jgi:hypothetical protein
MAALFQACRGAVNEQIAGFALPETAVTIIPTLRTSVSSTSDTTVGVAGSREQLPW